MSGSFSRFRAHLQDLRHDSGNLTRGRQLGRLRWFAPYHPALDTGPGRGKIDWRRSIYPHTHATLHSRRPGESNGRRRALWPLTHSMS